MGFHVFSVVKRAPISPVDLIEKRKDRQNTKDVRSEREESLDRFGRGSIGLLNCEEEYNPWLIHV